MVATVALSVSAAEPSLTLNSRSYAKCRSRCVSRPRACDNRHSRSPPPLLESPHYAEAFLVPENTVVNVKGDGPTLDVSHAAGRVFLLTLAITNIIEQESLDVGVFGSPDGVTWDPKPTAAFPQKFIARSLRCCSI